MRTAAPARLPCAHGLCGSNFGDRCNPFLEVFLKDLVARHLVDVLLEFVPPANYDSAARQEMVSRVAEGLDGPAENIGTQFFHELSKRERGRLACVKAGCTHYLLMDCDEFYLEEELRSAMAMISKRGYDSTACRMRLFLREPVYEYFPYDNFQVVPFICRCDSNSKLALAAPFAAMMADPTRRPEPLGNFFFFERGLVEMYHYSFVRLDMRKKFVSVSNRGNYVLTEDFLKVRKMCGGGFCCSNLHSR